MESYIRRGGGADQYPKVGNEARWILDERQSIVAVVCSRIIRIVVLTCCTSLLNDPNTGSPANVEASNLYKDNRKEYTKRVRETVEKSWED